MAVKEVYPSWDRFLQAPKGEIQNLESLTA